MSCSCQSVSLVYATRRAANCVVGNFNSMYQLVNDIRDRIATVCVRTCKTKTKIESKLKRQGKRKCQRKNTEMILKTKKTATQCSTEL